VGDYFGYYKSYKNVTSTLTLYYNSIKDPTSGTTQSGPTCQKPEIGFRFLDIQCVSVIEDAKLLSLGHLEAIP